jgi:hypothetical protein
MAIGACRASGSVYEQAAYLAASAAHVGAELELVEAGDAGLALLRDPDGSRRTVYGLPRPFGDASLEALADELAARFKPLTAVLSPLEPGPTLARLLCERGAGEVGARPIALAELSGVEDPAGGFHRRARRAIRTARGRGAHTRVEALAPWFGGFYREAMIELGAAPIYLFADAYFEVLAAVPHYQVTVRDDHGVAVAALFLHDGDEAYYHLGGRRAGKQPVLGAMSLALGEGVREAWRRGCSLAVLGGGRTDAPDDPLLTFKLQLATAARPRLSVRFAAGESA